MYFVNKMREPVSKVLVLFDFDGTITFKDSMFEFFVFTHGKWRFVLVMLSLAHKWIFFLLGFLSAQEMKEYLLKRFYFGQTEQKLYRLGSDFAVNRIPKICKESALKQIKQDKKNGHQVVIVSASAMIWLKDWARMNDLELICTQLDFFEHKFNGRILGKNCNGVEKVNRIHQQFSLDSFDRIIAYGDSKGDLPMLELAHEKYYRFFK